MSKNATGQAVQSGDLLAFYIPADLADAFDDFVHVAVQQLDGFSDRKTWSDEERRIVEWMEKRRWNANKHIGESE